MSESITLDRGFEVKTFKTIEEKNIFDYRDRLIRLWVGLRYHMDIINTYLEEKDEQKMLLWLQNYLSHLAGGKLQLKTTHSSLSTSNWNYFWFKLPTEWFTYNLKIKYIIKKSDRGYISAVNKKVFLVFWFLTNKVVL